MRLRVFDDMTVQQVADRLGLSLHAAQQASTQAAAALRQTLTGSADALACEAHPVRIARQAKGWSQTDLAEHMGRYIIKHGIAARTRSTSLRQYVSAWERGVRPITEPYAGVLRAVLGIDPNAPTARS